MKKESINSKKKEIKNFTFVRTIQRNKKEPNIDEKETPNSDKDQIILSFMIILYEEEIDINIKEVQDNLNTEKSFYQKYFTFEEFAKINKFFEFYRNLNNIFESLKKNFENNKDTISLEKENISINFKISLDILE